MTPVILETRLKMGGRWYRRGDRVEMPDKDARDYLALRMARAAGVAPVAVRLSAPAPSPAEPVSEPSPPQPVAEPPVVVVSPAPPADPKEGDVVEKAATVQVQQRPPFQNKHGKGRR